MDSMRAILILILLSVSLQSYLTLSLPHEHIKSKGQDCEWKYGPYNVSVNLLNLTEGVNVAQVSGVQLDGQNKSLMVGFCRGLNMTCEGKKNKGTAACLINTSPLETVDLKSLTATNSTNIGHISNSHISMLNHHLIYETISYNKSCTSNDKSVKGKLGLKTRVEFYCDSNSTAKQPIFDKFDNCTYNLHWPTARMCHVEESLKDGHAKSLNVTLLKNSTNPSTKLTDQDLKINLDPKPKSAKELHEENLAEAKKLTESSHNDNSTVSTADSKVNSSPTNKIIDKKDLANQDINNATHDTKAGEKVQVPANSTNESSHEPKKNITSPEIEPQTVNKIGKMHKIFMIGLILVCLAGFITGMIILDRKTSFGAPFVEIRRRARQALNPEPTVPYTRVDRYNDCLNL